MSNLFLTSSIQTVANDVASYLNKGVKNFLFIKTASTVEAGPKDCLKLDRDAMICTGSVDTVHIVMLLM